MTKYIFVTGGVVSGLGKGITASSFKEFIGAAFARTAFACANGGES